MSVPDVKFCAESNGATPEAEKWSKKKRTQKNFQKLLKTGKNKGKNLLLRTNQTKFLVHHIKNPVPNPMVLLPGLKIGVIKKYAQKLCSKWPKMG